MPSPPIATAAPPRRAVAGLVAWLGLVLTLGCESLTTTEKHYIGEADLHYYVDRATSIASPETTRRVDANVATLPPHTISARSHQKVRDIALAEAIHLALSHSKVIRQRGTFLSPSNTLLTRPGQATTVFDPAIQQTNTSFGNRGVQAALADFDATFTSQLTWGRNERIQNSLFGFGQTPGATLQQDTAQFVSRLEKPFATGSVFSLSHTVNYQYNNATNRLFDSAYSGNVLAEFRHPLLRGSGLLFNRVAGPQSLGNVRGAQFSNGVLIARINSDIEVAEFQRAARNLVREVEQVYWNLVLAYHIYHAQVVARNNSLKIWRVVKARYEKGLRGGGEADLAQVQDRYFEARARAEAALAELYRGELELRRITGLPVNDGTILRPVDDPVTARFRPDWYTALCAALTTRPELRRQKWRIQSLELQLAAAKNFARPRLDLVSQYRVNALGDKLFAGDDNDIAGTTQGLDSYYNNLFQGSQTGWNIGLEFSMPIGLRAAKTQVRWYELRLAKSRAVLGTMEHEISHQLAASFQSITRYYQTAQTNLNRRIAAARRVEAYRTRYMLGGAGAGGSATSYLDLLLRSQISLAQAEAAYWESIVAYNQAIADLFLRQGTLLERYNIRLAEGRWAPDAYEQAIERAWKRSHALDNPLLNAVPDPFAIPGETMPALIPRLIPAHATTPRGQAVRIPPAPGDPPDDERQPAPEAPDDSAEPIPVASPGSAGDSPRPAPLGRWHATGARRGEDSGEHETGWRARPPAESADGWVAHDGWKPTRSDRPATGARKPARP